LKRNGQHDITALALNRKEADILGQYGVKVSIADLLDANELKNVICDAEPDHIYHLAAQSSVELSWSNPALTADINIKGTINLLEIVRTSSLANTRVLLIGSGDEYGNVRTQDMPVDENTRLAPTSVYAVTKVCQNMLGRVYFNAFKMNIVMTRAFNHIGPGQSPIFVVSDFCRQMVEIEKGRSEPVIRVGNTTVQRDFTDVRDIVRAYALLMQQGAAGETYNISSGKSVSIQAILDIILAQSGGKIRVETDQKRLRPSDTAALATDSSKLRELTGWENQISLEQSINDTILYWKERE
jgi:GDP-4-dehydro-6-deoxy-D-mannose reductase